MHLGSQQPDPSIQLYGAIVVSESRVNTDGDPGEDEVALLITGV